MAKVTFINAILSGKLGGTIYARNKGGSYLKLFSKPLDPKSAAQQANRIAFGIAAGTWHALSDAQKALWNTYGANIFMPKGSSTMSVSSGFNAYLSTMNQAQIATSLARTTTMTAPVGSTLTFTKFTPGQTPPNKAMGSAIQDASGAPVPITMVDATLVGTSGVVTATFSTSVILNAPPKFLDSNNSLPVGIELQISIPKTQIANYVTGKNNQIVGVMKPPTITNAAWSGGTFEISMAAADLDIAKFKTWVQDGQVVQMDAYLVSEVGESRHIGSKKITVT